MKNKETYDKFFLSKLIVVIDDELNIKDSSIETIIKDIENNGACVAKYEAIPDQICWNSFSQASCIILDWDIKEKAQTNLPEGVQVGSTFIQNNKDKVVGFIKYIIARYFVPIFIFSQENTDEIKRQLNMFLEIANALNKSQLIIKSKQELTIEGISKYFSNWLKSNNSVLTIKKFDEEICRAKNQFYMDMNAIDSNWVDIAVSTIQADSSNDYNFELNELLMQLLQGRFNTIDFTDLSFSDTTSISKDTIKKLYNSIKYREYKSLPKKKKEYTGDVYLKKDESANNEKEYLINITAECDLRHKGCLLVPCTKSSQRPTSNMIIDKINEYNIPIFLNEDIMNCSFLTYYRINKVNNFNLLEVEGNKYERIGRLLNPYITILIKRFSNYLSRQGSLAHPIIRLLTDEQQE